MTRVGFLRFVVPCLACLSVPDRLFAQLIRVDGEFQVNVDTTFAGRFPSVDLDSNGDFVVSWEGYDGSGTGIFGRRFNAAGTAISLDFQVNTYTTNSQELPAVASNADSSFVVVWENGAGNGIFGRRFDAAGLPVAVEFQVNSYTGGFQSDPAVGLDSDGGFVVAWFRNLNDGSYTDIFARRFDSAGAAQGFEFQVSYAAANKYAPAVASDRNGDFVVAWESFGQDGSGRGIFARRFDSAGAAQTDELQVNSNTPSNQFGPAVASGGAGDFVVVWTDYDGYQADVFVRRFGSTGLAQAAELQVNSFTASDQYQAVIASNGGRDFVVAWVSYGQAGIGAGNDIFAQRLATLAVLDIDGNGATAALSDGILVIRYLFGFTGATLVANAVDGACTRCTAPAIEAYLATLI